MMDDVEVRPSPIHGQGLFARRALPARRKIGELTGELIRLREARRRAKQRACIQIVEFDDGWALDAATGGNAFRHVNHSCRPNTFMRRIGHRLEFYALRPIRAGEELTCNYGETQHEGTLRCRCGAEGCRGRL
jgi:SET domain-containing protein